MSDETGDLNRHDPDELHGEPAAGHDPVADFFTEARAHVGDERSTDLDWQRIVSGARRASRRRNRLALMSSAAVAIIAIFAIFLWQQQGIGGGVQRGEAVLGGTGQAQTGEPTTSPSSVSSQQAPTRVPDSFHTWSVSNAGQSTLYALGQQDCGGDICPVLLKSGTNGGSWTAVHKFTGTDVSAASGSDIPQIQPQRALSQTRFATPSVGYVFGGDLWVTRDSGASFTKMSHPGDIVLDVEINQGQAVLLSADNCGQGVCNGPIHVSRFDPAKGRITESDAQMTPTTPVRAGNVAVQQGQVFVQLTASDASKPFAPMRLDGSKLTTLGSPSACSGTALQAVTPATNLPPKQLKLFALCNPSAKGTSHTSYTIVSSDNAGKNWQSISVNSSTFFEKATKSISNAGGAIATDVAGFRRLFNHPSGVVVSTCHAVKGEEYDTVIAFGLLRGYVPNWEVIIHGAPLAADEQESKLIYVICSRAKRRLHLIAEDGHKTKSGKPYETAWLLRTLRCNYDS